MHTILSAPPQSKRAHLEASEGAGLFPAAGKPPLPQLFPRTLPSQGLCHFLSLSSQPCLQPSFTTSV
jgi:hypothetical protein